MSIILDIPYDNIKLFLLNNKIDVLDNEHKNYTIANNLIQNPNSIFEPISIIEWIIAHNLKLNNANISPYSINDIQQLSSDKLQELATLLTTKSTNIVSILKYLGKLNSNEIVINKYIIPKEILKEIIKYMDNKSIASILSTNQILSKMALEYKREIYLHAIERELKYVNNNERKYCNNKVFDYHIGDRIFTYLHEDFGETT